MDAFGGDPLRIFIQRIFFGLVGSISIYISTWNNFDMLRDQILPNPINWVESYDFIVVGGGSSGSVVANRLSENFRVLLLEAGGDPYPLCNVPGFSFFMLNYPEIDWMHKTVPQKDACLAMHNYESPISQGKGLGGTSNLNFMVHSRGHQLDFEKWASIANDSRWNYDGLLPYFKKSEDFQGIYKTDEHGHGGPMKVSVPPFQGSGDLFVQAAKDLGYQQVDLNGKYNEGFDLVYSPIKFGRRQGTYQSYLKPIKQRRSLTIGKFAHVNKILIRGDNNEAYGVEYDRHGRRFQALATKEVILSAGAINSPKILMLSGIGPKEHLESHGIEVKADSPAVGENLQDHVSTYVGPFFADDLKTVLLDRDLNGRLFTDFLNRGGGPLTSSGAQAMGFISSSVAKARGEESYPDLQYIYLGVGQHETFGKDLARAFNLKSDMIEKYYQHSVGKNSFLIATSLARPNQRGNIKLRQPGSYSPLLIDPRYLQDEQDVKVLIEGVKKAVELVETTPTFQKLGSPRLTNETFPGCENFTMKSDEYWSCYIRHLTLTQKNYVGTCSMGARGSQNAVVDPELNVIGVQRLRVIDPSVFPTVPVGQTNAPSIMIGEKGADLIKKIWLVEPSSTTTTTESSSSSSTSINPLPEDILQVVGNTNGSEINETLKDTPKDSSSQKLQQNEIKYRPPLQCKYGFCNEKE